MGPRALTASSGLAHWSMAVDRTFGSVEEKSSRSWGVKGVCHLGLLPPTGGERGSPSQFPRQLKKIDGISAEPFFWFPQFRREVHDRDDNKKRINLFIEVSADKKYPVPIQVGFTSFRHHKEETTVPSFRLLSDK